MPLTLSLPAGGPTAPASTGNRLAARSGDQDSAQPGSFGEAMARSREAGREKIAEPVTRPPISKPVRRPADAEKSAVQDSASPEAALLVNPSGNRLDTIADAASAATTIATATATATATASGIAAGAAAAGLDGNQGTPAAPGLIQPLLTSPASSGDAPAHAQETASRKPVPRSADPGGVMPMATDPPAVTALAGTTHAGLRDTSSGQGDDGAKSEAAKLDARSGEPLQAADITNFADGSAVALPAAAAPQQPGSTLAPSVSASTVSGILLPEVGSNEWGKALSQQVLYLSTGEGQMAELQLNPPGLGPLKVTLSVIDQQMQAAFVSAHSSVRAAVETALPQLRALLAESGISLGQTSVGAESQPQTTFAGGQGGFSRQSPRQDYPGKDAGMADLMSDQPVAVKQRTGQGLRIDTYA